MGVVGFSLTRIKAERFDVAAKGVKVMNDASIMDVQELAVSFGKDKQPTLKFRFHYKCVYQPKIADIEIIGEVLYLQEAKRLKEIEEHWKKNRSLPQDVAAVIMNPIISKCSIQAINIASDLNVPSPIPLPKIAAKKK